MVHLVAINFIQRAKTAKPPYVLPKAAFTATDKEWEILKPLKAARLATRGEALEAGLIDDEDEPSVDREALEVRANELGVSFKPNLGDDKLAERVKKAEEAAAQTPVQPEDLPADQGQAAPSAADDTLV